MTRWLNQILDVTVYAVSITLVLALFSAVVSLPFGNVLSGVKWGLFIVGWIIIAYGSFQLRPKPSKKPIGDSGGNGNSGGREETWFQEQTQRLPPLRRRTIPPEQRLSMPLKLFISGIVVLVTSFLMETVLGVGG